MLTRLEDVTKHTNRVLCILGQNPGRLTLQGTNTYLVGTGKLRTLIDPGEGIKEYQKLLFKEMQQRGIEGFDQILCTHHHVDHIGGIPDVLEKLRGQIYKRSWSSRDSLVLSRIAQRDVKIEVRDIEDGQVFKTEGATLRAVLTPGHSDDHVGFLLEEENSFFSGDCVLGEGSTKFNHFKSYMDSLHRIYRLDGVKSIYPGHGPLVKDGIGKVRNYIAHRNKREKELLDLLAGKNRPMEIPDIVAIVYKDTPKNLWPHASKNVYHTLSKLLEEKKVLQVLDAWVLSNTGTTSVPLDQDRASEKKVMH